MNRSIASYTRFVLGASRKLAVTLFAGAAFAAATHPQTILADDSAKPQKGIHAQITRSQAEQAALAKVLGGKVKAAKLAPENGRLIWSVDVIRPVTKRITAIQVDAQTGKVLSKMTEHPGDRAEDSTISGKGNQ